MIRTCLAALLIFGQAAQAGYSEHHEYLSKIIEPATSFVGQNDSIEPSRQAWFKQVDQLLNPNKLGSYKASFLLSFDGDGNIDAMSIKDLQEDDLNKFKEFVAGLISLDFDSLPDSIDPKEIFIMDGELLYLERPSPHLRSEQVSRTNYRQVSKDIIISPLASLDNLELELIEPSYIDYPSIGELLKFKLKDGSILDTKVLNYDSKFLYLSFAKLRRDKQSFYQDTVFRVARPKKDSKSIMATAIGAGLVSASSAGFTASSLSYGIAPAALGLAGLSSNLLKSNEEQVSFKISKGDKIMAEWGNKTRGEKQ